MSVSKYSLTKLNEKKHMNLSNLAIGQTIEVLNDFGRGYAETGVITDLDLNDNSLTYMKVDNTESWAYASALINIIG